MMNRNEKLVDATIRDLLQRPAVRLVEDDAEDTKRREEDKEEGKKKAVSQVGTKVGEEALRFFRGRDFETCLSALKSREIKESRPKPGEHV